MLIKKKGKIIVFECGSCGCIFVAGLYGIKESDGNYYCNCPMCGADCHTDVSRQSALKKEGLE